MRFPHCQPNPGIRSAWVLLFSFFYLLQNCLSENENQRSEKSFRPYSDPSRGHQATSPEELPSALPSSSAGHKTQSEIPVLSLSEGSNNTILFMRGYQNYDVVFDTNKQTFTVAIGGSSYLIKKANKLLQLLQMAKKYKRISCPNTVSTSSEYGSDYDSTMSFLDHGSSGGLFPLLASSQQGFGASYGVDHDTEYVELSNKVYDTIYSKMNGWQVVPGGRPFAYASSISSADLRADVVNAMAVIHWMYSATENYRSIRKVIKRLADSARLVLIVEWIDPEDGAIKFLGHTQMNEGANVGNSNPEDAYTFVNFINALKENCAIVSDVGAFEGIPTRRLYYCSKYAHPDEANSESQYLHYNASNSVTSELDCFGQSAVDKSADGQTVTKHINLKDFNRGILHRDFYWLEMLRLKGHTFVPVPLLFSPGERTLKMSYEGEAVTEENLPKDWEAQLSCIEEALYSADCHHNDEIIQNFVVNRNGQLRIINFGWARHRETQDLTCKDFCNPFPYHMRPPEATSCSSSVDECEKEYVFERPFYAGLGFESVRADFRRMAGRVSINNVRGS